MALASGFPRQETGSLLEWLLLPLINFVLLGFLPIGRSREVNSPSLAAGCGQLFHHPATRLRAGRGPCGDPGLAPRRRQAARGPTGGPASSTDIFDATPIASCRMYDRSIDVWRGLSKNATEGIGSPATILPFTILLGGGQVVPPLLAGYGVATGFAGWPAGGGLVAVAAAAVAYLPRLLDAIRFRQSLASVVVHPLAVAIFLAIQWVALARKALGLRTTWRGRSLAPQ